MRTKKVLEKFLAVEKGAKQAQKHVILSSEYDFLEYNFWKTDDIFMCFLQ